MKGKELKSKNIKLELVDGVHECVFDMNTLAEIEDIYGDVKTGIEAFNTKPIGALRVFIYALLKEEKESLTIYEAGKLIPMNEIERVIKSISESLSDAMPNVIEKEEENKEDTESKNA